MRDITNGTAHFKTALVLTCLAAVVVAGSAGRARAQPAAAEATAPAPAKLVRAVSADAIPFSDPGAGALPSEPTWFTRAPLRVVFGSNGHGNDSDQTWALTFMGFLQADYITDSTRSYDESIGQGLVARSDTYQGRVGRTQFSLRNTRIGLVLESPSVGGVAPSAVFQGDFAGNQPGVPYIAPGQAGGETISERSYYDSPTFRIRHAYIVLRSRFVDVTAGKTFEVFGWPSHSLACSILGLPNEVGSRTPQLRLSRTFGAGRAVSLEVAAAAMRPGQRDSMVPDFEGGVRLRVNGWKGITTPGIASTIAAPLSIGLSGVARQFKVNAFTPPPAQASNHAMGWGAAIDAFIPVIRAAHGEDRGNRLSLLGSFIVGTGIADLIAAGGGARFPTLPNPAQASPPPEYTPNVDDGLVSFDTRGVLHTLDWWAAKAALQYYFPGSGRLFLAANVTYAHSRNIAQLFPRGGAEVELLGAVADSSLSGDGSLLWDATPAIRVGVAGQYTRVRYLDGLQPHNLRGLGVALYVF